LFKTWLMVYAMSTTSERTLPSKERAGAIHKRRAFTLIELLIVVAIIAILAAIAVPNFLEAQTRATVTRVKSDIRAFGVALEAYKLDNNQIPIVQRLGPGVDFYAGFLDLINDPNKRNRYPGHLLTSPIAYIEQSPVDPYNSRLFQDSSFSQWKLPVQVSYVISWSPMGLGKYPNRDSWIHRERATGESMRDFFTCDRFHAMLESAGPDLIWWNYERLGNLPQTDPNPFFYDPTNGTISFGQIVWLDVCGYQAPR